MKACKFCGTQIGDDGNRCPSCGSNVFLNICENCGSQFDSGFCPNCGVKAGQKKKICPECLTAYFSNACPNCGYNEIRKPVQQTVIHKHVYEEKLAPRPTPAPQPAQPQKKSGCGTAILILIVFILIVFMVRFCSNSSSKTTASNTVRTTTFTRTSVTATKDPTPTPTPDPEIVQVQAVVDAYFDKMNAGEIATPDPETLTGLEKAEQRIASATGKSYQYGVTVRKAEYMGGRGKLVGTSEPDYKGIIGYAVVSSDQKLETSAFQNTPWTVPVYQKDKQFWQETGAIDHKTKVVVIRQELEPKGSKYSATARYIGYLQIIRLDTNEICYLNVTNFVAAPYWDKKLTAALENGYCIAVFKQISDYYPVTRGNEKVELEDGALVFIPMKGTTYGSSPDKDNNSVKGVVFKEWKYGFGGVDVFFNEADLELYY